MMRPIGLISGTGIEELVPDGRSEFVETRYGPTSSPVSRAQWEGAEVVHIARHGTGRRHAPSQIPYRANAIALREHGVDGILATHAAGSLRPDVERGHLVVCDQLIDATKHRADTVEERLSPHTAFADPFCARLRKVLIDAATALDVPVHPTGTVVVIEGPRFSTRAESQRHAAQGATIVNMTAYPEAFLARELGMCYASVAYVTDYDSGVVAGEAVRHEDVVAGATAAASTVAAVLRRAVAAWPDARWCDCTPARPNGLAIKRGATQT